VEESLRASGQAEIPTDEVGLAILTPLRELDVVAYLRFASVYKHYQSIDDFEAEISRLREAVEAAAATSPPAPEQLF
jgi:transcriptional repressor NrdR